MALSYCDVAAMPDGTVAFVTSEDAAIVARDRWSTPVRRQLLGLRCGVCEGQLVAVGKESDSAPDKQDGGTVWVTVGAR